jgi:hypothetical protein
LSMISPVPQQRQQMPAWAGIGRWEAGASITHHSQWKPSGEVWGEQPQRVRQESLGRPLGQRLPRRDRHWAGSLGDGHRAQASSVVLNLSTP